MQKFKSAGIEVPQLIKTALAIMSSRQAVTDVALFGQYQAARTWPFLAEWQALRMPGAMDISKLNENHLLSNH